MEEKEMMDQLVSLCNMLEIASLRARSKNDILVDAQTATVRTCDRVFAFIRDTGDKSLKIESSVGHDLIGFYDVMRIERVQKTDTDAEHLVFVTNISGNTTRYTFYGMPAENFKPALPEVPDEIPVSDHSYEREVLSSWAILRYANNYMPGDKLPWNDLYGWREDSEKVKKVLLNTGIIDTGFIVQMPYDIEAVPDMYTHKFGEKVTGIDDKKVLDALFYNGFIYEEAVGKYCWSGENGK